MKKRNGKSSLICKPKAKDTRRVCKLEDKTPQELITLIGVLQQQLAWSKYRLRVWKGEARKQRRNFQNLIRQM